MKRKSKEKKQILLYIFTFVSTYVHKTQGGEKFTALTFLLGHLCRVILAVYIHLQLIMNFPCLQQTLQLFIPFHAYIVWAVNRPLMIVLT